MTALPPVPQFRPYEPGPFRMAMGLQAVAAAEWLEITEDYAEHMAERYRLLRETPNAVLACLPEAEAAAAELLDVLVGHLVTYHSEWFSRSGNTLHNHLLGRDVDLTGEPLSVAGHLVQEDFCLNQAHADGHHLTGAVLCFPTRWTLSEKLGQPLMTVHEKVPFYGERLANPVERFFSSIREGKLAQRLNWSVIDDPTLFQLQGKGRDGIDPNISPQNALGKLWLRVERQTFRRLPVSQAVVFGIRVHVTPLQRVVADAAEKERLVAALRALPPEMAHYKSTGRFIDALMDAIEAIPA